MILCQRIVEDVSAASAAYLYNLLPALMELSPPEVFERLKQHFETTFVAYSHTAEDWKASEPSRN